MYKRFIKRALDFLISLIAMPFVLLIIVIMSPIIFFSDRGPVFYNAARRGKNGKSFKMLKFRSMYVNSPDLRNSDGSTFNSDKDPRVTRIGHFMRKTSLDEVPQLINVFLGHMSFVGPRPTLVTRPFEETDVSIRKRYDVRPGITGYAQAYYRNSITQEEKFRYDCEYVEKISFVLDVRILLQTAKSVIKHDNIFVAENAESSEEKKAEIK